MNLFLVQPYSIEMIQLSFFKGLLSLFEMSLKAIVQLDTSFNSTNYEYIP